MLDNKSESSVSLAISVSANRRSAARVAHVEYPPRLDLVFLENGVPTTLYEAKAGYATDFQPGRISKADWYLGACVSDDLAKLARVRAKIKTARQHAALFYLYENSVPQRQLKYGKSPAVDAAAAISGLKRLVRNGTLIAQEVIDCGVADSAAIKIHLCIFEPSTGGRSETAG